MVQADDKESLQQYLTQYGQTLPNNEDAFYTGNYTADMIVGHYLSVAKQNGIRVDFSLHIPEACFIRDTDLCVLMGNCLENAIEACRKLPEEKRSLRVESAVKNKYLAITIANSYDGNTSMGSVSLKRSSASNAEKSMRSWWSRVCSRITLSFLCPPSVVVIAPTWAMP